jgi:membrane-bound serine protease (ClpP class)
MTWMAITILLLVLGAILLAIEVLVIPGFGVIGVLGLGCLAAAVGAAWWKLGPAWGGLSIGAGIVVSAFTFWLLPKTGMGRAMVLETQQRGRGADRALEELIGREGTAVTPLRPAGTIDVEGRPVDVVTDGIYVESGTRVRVARVEGARVVVDVVEPT